MSTFRLALKRYLEACKNDQSCGMTNLGEVGLFTFSNKDSTHIYGKT